MQLILYDAFGNINQTLDLHTVWLYFHEILFYTNTELL